jgi:hypothetical protein
MRLADALLSRAGTGRDISRLFGSGGGKRQRTIEAAATMLGLPQRVVHAAISRPVYAAPLVANLRRVAVLNEPPQWLVDPAMDAGAYEAAALAEWRRRWLPVAQRRQATMVSL